MLSSNTFKEADEFSKVDLFRTRNLILNKSVKFFFFIAISFIQLGIQILCMILICRILFWWSHPIKWLMLDRGLPILHWETLHLNKTEKMNTEFNDLRPHQLQSHSKYFIFNLSAFWFYFHEKPLQTGNMNHVVEISHW